jgi:hypothetical protein
MDFIFGSLLVKLDVAIIALLLKTCCVLVNIPKSILRLLVHIQYRNGYLTWHCKSSSNPRRIGLIAMATYSDVPFYRSNPHCMHHYIVKGTASEVPKAIFFPKILCATHTTRAHDQSIQWQWPSLGGCAKGRILQHRRKSNCVEASCTSLKIWLPGMDNDLSKS